MKLHYSQTGTEKVSNNVIVLIPYEITLLSNKVIIVITIPLVLIPYEITLLSN